MTSPRLIQNFRLGRALLFAGPELQTETLTRTLARLGVTLAQGEGADFGGIDENRDILIIDGDQSITPASFLTIGSTLPPAPVIGLVGAEAPSRLRMLSDAGATAFLRKPVAAAAVYSALFFGVNLHRRLRAMESRIAEHDRRRHDRRYVVKAVLALTKHGLNDDDAYAELRRESMRRRLPIEDFCHALCRLPDFAAAWPQSAETAQQTNHEEDPADASFPVAGRCPDGPDGHADGERRRTDQARRA